jgi:NADH:ubiquinone oxidoreductase subunit B-like Fe-S oxidoreductase
MRSLVKNNLNLLVAGFGCCKQEIFSSNSPLYDISRYGINFVSLPEDADVLVVQGFYNKIGEERILGYYYAMKDPKWVIAVGKCVVDGNLFCKNFKVLGSVKSKFDIDIYIPGCPPRPEAFMYAILRLLDIK